MEEEPKVYKVEKILNYINGKFIEPKNGKYILPDQIKQKFVFVGQEFENADYIYTNFIYKTDEKYNKNYMELLSYLNTFIHIV